MPMGVFVLVEPEAMVKVTCAICCEPALNASDDNAMPNLPPAT